MTLEQKIEQKLLELEQRIEKLEDKQPEEYVSPQKLAEIMDCSTNHIYVQIREKKIRTANGFEKPIRIPMSQFSDDRKVRNKVVSFKNDISQMRQEIWG